MDAKKEATLGDLVAAYLCQLESDGRSSGTLHSYAIELALACTVLGETTPLAELTPQSIEAYIASERVTKRIDGVPKAKTSVDKTRRVLRLALAWAAERRMVRKAQLPASMPTKPVAKKKAKARRKA